LIFATSFSASALAFSALTLACSGFAASSHCRANFLPFLEFADQVALTAGSLRHNSFIRGTAA
jgi:hypothetical protein